MTDVPSIGGYEALRVLGEGGMGTVHLARDPVIGRLVAIKLIRRGLDSPALRERLNREARAAGCLNHPNIVTIFHVGDDDGCPYIVMEYVEGRTLAAMIRERTPLTLARKLHLLERICVGLACAHDAGLVHRDIKPANIIVDASWEPKILDFGVAKVPDASLVLTHEQTVLGTLSYMSPEQLSNEPVDHRSDLFSVAALAYELITFRRAFSGEPQHVIAQILQGSPRDMATAIDDPELARIVARGLSRRAADRFPSAREMAQALGLVQKRVAEDPSDHYATVPYGESSPAGVAEEIGAANHVETPPARFTRRWITTAAASLIAVAAIGLALVYNPRAAGDHQGGSTESPPPVVDAGRSAATSTPPSVAPAADVLRPKPTPPRPSVDADRRPSSVVAEQPQVERAEPPSAPSPTPGIVLPIGTPLMVSVSTTLDSRVNAPGDQFVGSIAEPVTREGRLVVPAGARVEGRVEQSSLTSSGRPFLQLSLTGLAVGSQLLPIRTGFYRAVAPVAQSGPSFTAIVIGGLVGAGIGAAMDGTTGALAGAALGAAGGGAVKTAVPLEYRLGNRLPFKITEAVVIDITQ